jgi:hypothetical protein
VTLSHVLSPVADRSFLYQAVPESPGTYRIASLTEVVARLNKQFRLGSRTMQYFTMMFGCEDAQPPLRDGRTSQAGACAPRREPVHPQVMRHPHWAAPGYKLLCCTM